MATGQPGLISTMMAIYTSFFSGFQPIDGGQLQILANQINGGKSGLKALAGGGQVGATPLSPGVNEIATVTTGNDSVALPAAIPFQTITVINDGANSVQVFGQASNAANGNVGDTIAPHGSAAQEPTGTGVAQGGGTIASYVCFALGSWKQFLTA